MQKDMPEKLSVLISLLLFIAWTSASSAHGEDIYVLINENHEFTVSPASFLLSWSAAGKREYLISGATGKKEYEIVHEGPDDISWLYPCSGISVFMKLYDDYLDVSIQSKFVSEFTWPRVMAGIDAYTIPLYQGKYIPADDSLWAHHLESRGELNALEALSMQFFALNMDERAFVFVVRNIFNNRLGFSWNKGKITLDFTHEFPETAEDKEYGFRIYPVSNDIAGIAKTYRNYVLETRGIITLEKKAKDTPGIRKLYGAPHIYIWNNEFLVERNVKNRPGLARHISVELSSDGHTPSGHLFNLFNQTDMGSSLIKGFGESGKAFLNTEYGMRLFIHSVNEVLRRQDFFDETTFGDIPHKEKVDLPFGGPESAGTNTRLFNFNKALFYHAYSAFLDPVEEWGGAPLSLLADMQDAGIKRAWLGLNCRTSGEIHPAFVSEANSAGFLIGPYDSYHSIHPPGEERWVTATFCDTTLYHTAYIMNRRGEPVGGFLGVGRKLNPLLSFTSVRKRTKGVFDQGIEFNSWFVDCDATGECYDDYTPSRMSSQKEDMEARLRRMDWIAREYNLVVGSETGNDFSANTIAFAHGMTTPVIAWGDADMRSHRDSEYFVGAYYSMWGGIPARYVKQVPLKEDYRYIYYDNSFNIPLFQLVYNNAVITSHHWEWGSLKVPEEIPGVSLREILYNVPPLYHLDRHHWEEYKEIISRHARIFSKTHSRVVTLEMTGFEWLSADRLIQKTVFGESLEMIANFGSVPFRYGDITIGGEGLAVFHPGTEEYFLYYP
jgi:hypothetical protein